MVNFITGMKLQNKLLKYEMCRVILSPSNANAFIQDHVKMYIVQTYSPLSEHVWC